MSDKERSRENVGRREENLKVKARQLNLMVREAEARSSKMEHVSPPDLSPVFFKDGPFPAPLFAVLLSIVLDGFE